MATNFNNCISMKNCSSIEHVEECAHLGNTVYSDIYLKCIDGSVSDLFIRTNSLLYYFLNVDSNILSKLPNTYCMSIYGSQLWKFNCFSRVKKISHCIFIAIRKLKSRTHNVLINKIYRCAPIDVSHASDLFKSKLCIKFVRSLRNCKYALYNVFNKYKFYNCLTY